MRRIIALLLALVMLCTLFVGCGKQEEKVEEPEKTEEKVEEKTEAPEEEKKEEEKPEEDKKEEAAPAGTGADFDEFPHPIVKPEGDLKVAVIAPDLTAESLNRMDHQLQIECAHRGWEYLSILFGTDDNYEASFQSAINLGADAIVLLNTASRAQYEDLYNEAREMGIGVYSIEQCFGGTIAGFTSPGSTMMAELLFKVGADYAWDLDCGVIRCDNQQGSRDRTFPLLGFFDYEAQPNMKLLVTEDISGIYQALGGTMMAGQEVAKGWMEKYGTDLQCIFSYGDNAAMGAAEAIMATGDATGEHTFTVGIDGGKQSWSYLRENTPLKYSYAQGFEQMAHLLAELIVDLQIEGLSPGDPGCAIRYSGEMTYVGGGIVTAANVPDVGSSIHEAFDYYDPSVTDPETAWWNWDDGPGIYMVEAYEKK